MAKAIEGSRSPFQRAADEGLACNSNSNSSRKKRGRRPEGTEDWTPKFIGALMEGYSVRKAAKIAGVDLSMPYIRRKHDQAFLAAWREACDIGTELMEQEAARRAFHGTLKPVFNKGVQCGVVREYSDTLMIFLLKARKPEVYRDGYEDGGAGRGNLVLNINIEPPTPEPLLVGATIEVQAIDSDGGKQDRQSLPEADTVLTE